MALPDSGEDRTGVGGRVVRQRTRQYDPVAERPEAGFVAGKACAEDAGPLPLHALANAAVRVSRGKRDDGAMGGQPVPARQRRRAIQQLGERRTRTDEVPDGRTREGQAAVVAPLTIGVQPLQSVYPDGIVAPPQ